MTSWLLLHYKLPNKPSALRVYIWRKLKRLGAILLHEAIWVMPDQPRTAEQIQWLAAEIEEMGGEAFYWRANSLLGAQEESIVQQFQDQVDAVYSKLLKRLEKSRPDLQAISREYQQALSQDFFQSKLGLLVREKLISKRGEGS
ncbi:MAG TPA: Chromate resistance protein ChrB [Anaerolineales bacterium]|nr:Chromate resistance protein ChrB [Anaerolineales bacterium]